MLALDELSAQLSKLVKEFSTEANIIAGRPSLIEDAASQSSKLAQGSERLPPEGRAYKAALTFLRGDALTSNDYYFIAGAFGVPIEELDDACVFGHPQFEAVLLAEYQRQLDSNGLRRLTWYFLLSSYFQFDPLKSGDAEKFGWGALRNFLESTWPKISQLNKGWAPEWMTVLRNDRDLLGPKASRKYADKFIKGDQDEVQRLATHLGIPSTSWFWHQLVLSCVEYCTNLSDELFRENIDRLIDLLKTHPAQRDQALVVILERYYKCTDKSAHGNLRDYVVNRDVWKNPNLKNTGIAPAWHQVREAVWKMVASWLNESNLRDFFAILAERHSSKKQGGPDKARLDFWTQYLGQISWTRLVVGGKTITAARRNGAIADLLKREEGAYARLTESSEADAFLMQIGDFIFVEFSITGRAAYAYHVNQLPFDRYEKFYTGGTDDLRSGFYGKQYALRISHNHGWEDRAKDALRDLGIFPDIIKKAPLEHATPNGPQSGNIDPSQFAAKPPGAPFDMRRLAEVVSSYKGAFVEDCRENSRGGRLWVRDPNQDPRLARILETWGFRWGNHRQAYYYPVI